MENKINLVELLKDCPKGMELESPMYDNLVFCEIDSEAQDYPIITQLPGGVQKWFTKDGRYELNPNAKCIIFPKGKTTWKGFVSPCEFKDGDIVATTNGRCIGITTGGNSESSIQTYCVIKISGEFEAYFGYKGKWMFSRFATEEEKQKLFDAIKANGYRWNAETKKLEKLIVPRFKVGDRIKWKGHDDSGRIEKIEDDVYHVDYGYDDGFIRVRLNMQDDYELVPDKFNITSLKPFDKVLVRDKDEHMWFISLFSHYNGLGTYKYTCINSNVYAQCIPYEGNEHLLCTDNFCDEYYNNW